MTHNQSNDFSKIDRKLSLSFGALIFALMATIFVFSVTYFWQLVNQEQNRLGSVIASSIGDSINKVSFSGKYQARLLIEDLSKKNQNIYAIMIQEPSGLVIAHSKRENNGAMILDANFEKAKSVLNGQGFLIQNVAIQKNDDELELIEIDMPFKKGYEDINSSDVIIKKFNIDIYPNNIKMAKTVDELGMAINKESILKHVIENYLPVYDYLILDCPPQLGLIINNALIASDLVFIPVGADVYSIEGIVDLIDTIEVIKEDANQSLEIGGVFLTKVNARTKLFQEAFDSLKEIFNDKMMNSYIRTATKVEECIKEGIPVSIKAPTSNPGKDYKALTKEMITMIEGV